MRGRLAAAATYGAGLGVLFGAHLGASDSTVAVVFGLAIMALGGRWLRRAA